MHFLMAKCGGFRNLLQNWQKFEFVRAKFCRLLTVDALLQNVVALDLLYTDMNAQGVCIFSPVRRLFLCFANQVALLCPWSSWAWVTIASRPFFITNVLVWHYSQTPDLVIQWNYDCFHSLESRLPNSIKRSRFQQGGNRKKYISKSLFYKRRCRFQSNNSFVFKIIKYGTFSFSKQ